MTLFFVATAVLVCLPGLCWAVDGQTCYTSGGVAGIVIATVVVTIVMGGLVVATVWYLWKQRSALSGQDKKKPGSTFFSSAVEKNCVTIDQPSEKKKRPPEVGGKEAYAFDNPFFKDDETDSKSKNPDAAEKGESGFRPDNGTISNSPNNKVNMASKLKKSRPFSNLQFPNVFHQGFKKPRAMDDTFIPKPLERVTVPLRGHDFTGLGFNICGNMRDGIFVKDVLHRGPASESGKIKAGDRIVGVWVSFGGMVYEDALTILSYASPYDVRLELEKTVDAKRNMALPASSPTSKTRLVSSFRTGQRLFHPLYRSQSFDDLTQIGKENHLPLNNNTGLATATNQNSCSSCPKRSQSIEAATGQKPRIQQQEATVKESRNSSTSSCESAKKASPITMKVSKGEQSSKKILAPDIKQQQTKTESAPLQQAASDLTSKMAVRATVNAKPTIAEVSMSESVTDQHSKSEDSSSGQEDKPTAPPRKVSAHIKRKAPAPPPKDLSKTETSAIVHRDAGDESADSVAKEMRETTEGKDDVTQKDDSMKSENNVEVIDACSLSGKSASPPTADDPTSSPKRKASSLGDLTTLDSAGHKKAPATSTILERAVSLDLQSLPEGNLVKQKMTLKTPTFEDPEDTSEEDLLPSREDKKKMSNLTRWEGTLSELQDIDPPPVPIEDIEPEPLPSYIKDEDIPVTITNGHSQSIHFTEDPEPSYFAFDSPSEESRTQILITSTPVKKIIETESFAKDVVDIDDIPYLGNQSSELSATVKSDQLDNDSSGTSPVPPPLPLTMPIIKPNISQYEKLPSPGKPQNDHSGQESPINDEQRQTILSQDIRSIETSYRPVFSSDSFRRERDINNSTEDSSILSALDIVNGNGLDISTSSYGQYKTASENSSLLETTHIEAKVTKDIKKPLLPEITGIKVHGGAAGFAKTLIISTPIEGESICLNADLDSPPPKLEPPF